MNFGLLGRLILCLVCLGMALPYSSCLPTTGRAPQEQPVGARILKGEVYVQYNSGKLRQVTGDGAAKEHAALSPDGSLVAFHVSVPKQLRETFLISLVDVKTGTKVREVVLTFSVRFLSDLSWLNNRCLLVRGEGAFLTILDVDRGKQLVTLYGTGYTRSPKLEFLAFIRGKTPLYGSIPRYFDSDYLQVLVSPCAEPAAAEGFRQPVGSWVVYPVVAPEKEFQPIRFTSDDQRHYIVEPLAWSNDSGRIAFVEHNEGLFWLVVLRIEIKESTIEATPRRFELAEEIGALQAVAWMNEDSQVKVSTTEHTYLIDIPKGVVEILR